MKNKKNMNKYSLVIVVFILMIIALIVYSNRSSLQMGAANTSKAVFSFEAGQQFQFDGQRGNILALSNEGLTCLNQSGVTQWRAIKQMSEPCMQSEGDYTLLFDRGSKEVSAYYNGAKMWQYETDQPIITAKINPRGFAAVLTHDVGYKGKIEVYDTHGELIYNWHLGENYVVDVDISPDCKYLAAASVSTSDVKLASKITVADINAEKVIGEAVRTDSLILMIKYQAGGNIVALGENELVGVSPKGEQKWAVSFEGRELQKFKLMYDTSSVLTFAGSRNNSVLEVYNKEGEKSGEYVSQNEIKAIDVLDKTISVIENRNILMLNLKGNVTAQRQLQKEARDVVLVQSGKAAAVTSSTVEVIKP